jgi:hypothetical protein
VSEPLALLEAEPRLRQLLDESAVSGGHVSPAEVLGVFQAFADEAVACTSDSVLFEWDVFAFGGRPLIHMSWVRQFSVEEPSEDDPELWQIHCELLHEPTASFSRIGGSHLWSDQFPYGASDRAEGLRKFFDRVKASAGFVEASNLADWRLEVWATNPE